MLRHNVQFRSGDSALRGWYLKPDEMGPHPALVWCPGFTGTKYASFAMPYFRALSDAGIAVLAVDYRGWGDSEGERGALYPDQQIEDIRNALSYLQTRSDVMVGALGLFGVSFGGGHAVMVAGIDERIRCAIAVSPVADGEAWLRGMRDEASWQRFLNVVAEDRRRLVTTGIGARVDPVEEIMIQSSERARTSVKGTSPFDAERITTPLACADAIRRHRPVLFADRVAPGALLIIIFTGDVVVDPGAHGEAIYAAAHQPKRIVRLSGDKHYEGYVDFADEIITEAVSWCRRYLAIEELP